MMTLRMGGGGRGIDGRHVHLEAWILAWIRPKLRVLPPHPTRRFLPAVATSSDGLLSAQVMLVNNSPVSLSFMKQSSCLFLCVTSRLSLIPCNKFLTLMSLFDVTNRLYHFFVCNNPPVSFFVSLYMSNTPVCTLYSNLSVSLFIEKLGCLYLCATTCLSLFLCINLSVTHSCLYVATRVSLSFCNSLPVTFLFI